MQVMRMAGGWGRSVPGYARHVTVWCKAALAGTQGKVVSVVLADDALVRDLNHSYRGRNKATNVLSFPGEGEELGDIIMAYQTVHHEAKLQKKTFAHHMAHLVVHGCLHLLGYDHENARDAMAMEAREVDILAHLGIADPYRMAV